MKDEPDRGRDGVAINLDGNVELEGPRLDVHTDVLGAHSVNPIEHPVMGGEDFSFYGERVPACFFFLGLIAPEESHMPSVHNARFNFNDEAISTGIEVFCRLALADDATH